MYFVSTLIIGDLKMSKMGSTFGCI